MGVGTWIVGLGAGSVVVGDGACGSSATGVWVYAATGANVGDVLLAQ